MINFADYYCYYYSAVTCCWEIVDPMKFAEATFSTDESPFQLPHQRAVEAFCSTTYYTEQQASLAVFLLTLDVPGRN